MMEEENKQERLKLIQVIETSRNSRLICYLTGDRQPFNTRRISGTVGISPVTADIVVPSYVIGIDPVKFDKLVKQNKFLQYQIDNLANQRLKVVVIQNLESEQIFLQQPLYVNLEMDQGGNLIMSSIDLEIFGYGETELEAKRDFLKTLKDLFFVLRDEQDKLHHSSLSTWKFLQRIIKEK